MIYRSPGSGKTTLLNAVAGRLSNTSESIISGRFLVDDKMINPADFRRSFAYVMQHDSLVSTATPREALTFAAVLRLPREVYDDAEIKVVVNHTMVELGIEHCADTMIGDGRLLRGLSGGERKRTSVGVELITSPSILFLDEPISGLDSYNGYKLITLLKRIASSNAAVLLTIHQPSSEIFYLFDYVLFLKEGQVLFYGQPDEVLPYFSDRGYMFASNHNPADTVMFLSETESVDTLRERKVLMTPPFDESYLEEVDLTNGDSPRTSLSQEADMLRPDKRSHEAAPWVTQLYVLYLRGLRSTIRNKPALVSRFGVVVVINVATALIFIKAGSRDNAEVENINAHFGAATLVMIAAMFNSALPALLEVPLERAVFSREYVSGTYTVTAYSTAKVLLDIPLSFMQAVVQCVIVFYIIEFQGNLGFLILAVWVTALTSAALAVMMGCLVVDSRQAIELAPLLFPPQILFAGFFISTDLIPVWLRWLQWLCPLRYGVGLFLINEFAPFRSSCDGDAAEACSSILESNNIRMYDWWVYTIALVALFVGFRVMAATALLMRESL